MALAFSGTRLERVALPRTAIFDLEKVIFALWLALLVWLPIPLGSNRAWAWSVMEMAAFALLGAWLLGWATGKVRVSEPLRRARWPLSLFAAWLLFQALHVVPMPREWVAGLSPEAARVHALAGSREWITLSLDPHASFEALLKGIAYAALFFLALALLNRRSRVRLLAQSWVYAALAMSVFAVLLHTSGITLDWFGTTIQHGASASGPYANRNHLAGYLEMSLAVGIGLLISSLNERRSRTWREFLKGLIELVFSGKMRLRLALCVLVIALVTTHSRMGNTAFFSSLLVAGAAGLLLSRHATRGTVVLLASLIVIDLFIVGSWFGVEKLAQRIEQTTAQDVEEREEPANHALDLVRDFPLAGAGPGSFYAVFPRYRAATIANFYDYAHNDYLQFASESGLLGLGILGLLVASALSVALIAQHRRRDPLMRGMSFASFMGITAILIHSTVDFNLQIPANAALFVVLMALAWTSLHLDRAAPRPAPAGG
jgi:O-antigen ligase